MLKEFACRGAVCQGVGLNQIMRRIGKGEGMLGGSVYIAFIRFTISLLGVGVLFSQISESRFSREKTVLYYGAFCVGVVAMGCIWYVVDWESCVRMVAFVMYLCFIVFSIWLSRDSFYLSVYKLALVFYLMAVFVIAGLEISIIFFDRNVWVDIIVRILVISLMMWLLDKYVKKSIQGFGNYIEKEVDRFSVAVMLICLLLGIGYILNPALNREMTPTRIYQIITSVCWLSV